MGNINNIIIIIFIALAQTTTAKATTGKSINQSASLKKISQLQMQKKNLSTNIQFDGQSVNGKTQSPFESITEVENDKIIDQLISVRKNFDDRRAQAKLMR